MDKIKMHFEEEASVFDQIILCDLGSCLQNCKKKVKCSVAGGIPLARLVTDLEYRKKSW